MYTLNPIPYTVQVWSEPSVVDAAAYEFENTAKYLTTAAEIAGDYVWCASMP